MHLEIVSSACAHRNILLYKSSTHWWLLWRCYTKSTDNRSQSTPFYTKHLRNNWATVIDDFRCTWSTSAFPSSICIYYFNCLGPKCPPHSAIKGQYYSLRDPHGAQRNGRSLPQSKSKVCIISTWIRIHLPMCECKCRTMTLPHNVSKTARNQFPFLNIDNL